MAKFYQRLSYSFGNEDWQTEHAALRIQPADRVLCVTASGDRPLNLLTKEVGEICAVDTNPLQNALFDLKKTALSSLPYRDYIQFLGVEPAQNRLHTYVQLTNYLDPTSRLLLGRITTKIARGILYQGSVEKLLKLSASCMRLLRGKKISTLFAMNDLEEQKKYVQQHWHTYLWKKAFRIGLHPFFARYFIKDPGLYEHIDPTICVSDYLYTQLHDYLNRHLAKQSILLSLILRGKVYPAYFPPYLTEEGVSHIKRQVHKSHFYTGDLVTYLQEAESQYFDCFSLSDVASYLNPDQFRMLIEGIYRCAKPGARFCIRQFLSNYSIPSDLAPYFVRDLSLEQQLQHEDRCCVYRFLTGTIGKR